MNYIQFSQNIKKKYPQYNDMEDLDLAKKMVAKFPQYNDVSFDDAGKNEQPQEKKSIVDSVIDKVGDGVSIIKDMYNKANNVVTEPVVEAEKNIKNVVKAAADTAVAPITKVANASVPVNINYKEIEKTPKKVEPVLRARTVEDDIVYNKTPIIRARTAYDESPLIIRPAPTPIIRARTMQDDINEVAARVNADRQGVEHDPIIEAVVNPATMLGKGVITKGGLAIFEAIQQAKNAAVSKYKGKDFDLLAYENLTSLLPENTPQALKIASGLAEMVGDAIIAGKLETATRNFFVRDTADRLKFELEKKGYNENEVNDVLSRFYRKIINRQEIKNLENKNLIGKQTEKKPVNIDEAISLNRQIRKLEVPQAKPKQEPLKADMDVEVVRENSKLNDANELVATKDITSGEIADDIIKDVAPLKKLEKANTVETVRQKVDKKFLAELRQDVVDVLNAGELKNIDFGELSAAKLEVLNKIRESNNVELLENNRLVIPANVVKKLIEKRMLKDKMSAEEVADLLIDVFHGNNTKIAGTKYKHIQVMFKVLDKVSKVGFVSKNPANADTGIKGGYKVDTQRLLNNIIKGEVLDGRGSPSSVLIPKGNKVAAPRNISALQNSPDDIIGQNNDGVNNLESDAIETGNENVDTSFEPAEFDEEYAKAMEEQQKLLIEEMKENGAIPTIKSEKQRLQDMGIGKMLRPKKNDPMYEEYKHLSPRMQREFFYDESDGIVNNSKGYTWDNAEHDLQQATGNDTASIWEELENIDRNVSKYENLGLASGGKNKNFVVNKNNFVDIASEIADKYSKKDIKDFDVNERKNDLYKLNELQSFIDTQKPLFTINGKELILNDKEYDLDNLFVVQQLAKNYYNKYMKQQNVVRKDLHGNINFTGREKFLSTNNRNIDGLKALPYVIPIIKHGKLSKFSPLKPEDKRYEIKKAKDIKGYYFINAIVKQNNKNKLMSVSLEVDNKGNFFYNMMNDVIDYEKIKLETNGDLSLHERAFASSNNSIAQNNRNDNSNNKEIGSYSSVLKTGVKVGAEETPKEVDFKLYQRTYDLAKKYMKGNIAESKYRPKNSLGVYYNYGSGKGNIFIKSLNTIDVVAHELVHAIDDELGISRNLLDSGNVVESELIRACKELYPVNLSKKPKEIRLLEGMASLVQHLVVNPEIAKRYPQAANFIRSNEKLNNFVQDARQIIVDYESQNNVQKVKSEIYDRPVKTVNKKKIPLNVKLDSQFFDSEAVLRWLDEDLYIAAKGYKTVLKGIIENNLTNNKGVMYILDKDGNPKKVSDAVNWKTFIEYAEKTGKEFNTFLVARRFFNWYKQRDKLVNLIEIDTNNLKSLIDKFQKTQIIIQNTGLQKELDAAKKLANKLNAEIHRLQNRINSNSEKLHDLKDIIKNHGKDENVMKDVYATLNTPENQKLATDYDFLIDCNLQTLKNAGLLTKEMYKEFSENEGYTPFNKVAYDEIAGDGGVEFVSRFAPNSVNVKNFKKIKGSELPIVSPLYSSVHFMTEAYKKAYRQIVYNKLGEIADMFPELMQKVQYVQGMEKDSSMIVARNDKGVRYGVKIDPFIKRVIEGVSNIVKPDWMSNMLLVPARFFTNMTTGLYPLYAPVNFIRDQITAFVNSQTGYIPIISAIETCLNPKYKKYADEYDNLFGVDNNTLLGTLKDIDPSDLSKAFKESWGKKWIKIGKKLFAFPSNFTETLTRKSEYVKARSKGYSVTESKRMADEITAAFGDRGLWFGNVGQVLTKSIPYFNSALQVVRQAGRAVNSKNVWKFLAATGLIAGAMVAANKSILDSENEEEKRQHMQLMAEQLAMYIYMSNGKADGMIRIPIDQTYSWLGVLMTMLYNQSKGYDYKVSDYVAGATAWLPDQINFFETVTNLLTEKDFSGLQKQIITSIPHLPRTILSGLFGKRTFPHVMDIVPKRLQRLEPRLQYDNRTSAVAKYLGDKLNLSPMKIDYFIDQGLGRTIRLGTRTTEASYGFLTDDKSWNENLKQMNPFVQQDFFSSGRIVQDFYDIKDEVDRLYISANEGLRKLTGKEMELLKKYKGYTDSIGKTMSKYNKLVQYIRDNKYKMSESELNSNELKKKRVEKQLFDAIRKMKGWKVEEMSN